MPCPGIGVHPAHYWRTTMPYTHIHRLGVYLIEFAFCAMDDYGNLIEVDFGSTLFNFNDTP